MNILAFPGQGSQKIGMGKIFYENFNAAKSVFEEVDDTLNFKLSKLIFDGDISELSLTSNTQPALMAVSIAILRVFLEEYKININQKYKTWIFLIFVIACVALISKIWLTLIVFFGSYLISIFYTVLQSRKIKI